MDASHGGVDTTGGTAVGVDTTSGGDATKQTSDGTVRPTNGVATAVQQTSGVDARVQQASGGTTVTGGDNATEQHANNDHTMFAVGGNAANQHRMDKRTCMGAIVGISQTVCKTPTMGRCRHTYILTK